MIHKLNIQKTYLFLLLLLASLELLGQSNGKVYILDGVANAEATTLGSKVTIKKGTPTSGSIFIAGSRTRDVKGNGKDDITNPACILDGIQTIDAAAVTALFENCDEVRVTGQLTVTGCSLDIPEGKTLSVSGFNTLITIDVSEITAPDARLLAENSGKITVKSCLWLNKRYTFNENDSYEITTYDNYISTLQTTGDNSTINIYTGYTPRFIADYLVAKGNLSTINIFNFNGITELVTVPITDENSVINIYSHYIIYGNPHIARPALPVYLENLSDKVMGGALILYAFNPTGIHTFNTYLNANDPSPGAIVFYSDPREDETQEKFTVEDFIIEKFGNLTFETTRVIKLKARRIIDLLEPYEVVGTITTGGGDLPSTIPVEWPETLPDEILEILPPRQEVPQGIITTGSFIAESITLESRIGSSQLITSPEQILREQEQAAIHLKATKQIRGSGAFMVGGAKGAVKLEIIPLEESTSRKVPKAYHQALTSTERQTACNQVAAHNVQLPSLGMIHSSQMEDFLEIDPSLALTSTTDIANNEVKDFAGVRNKDLMNEILGIQSNRWNNSNRGESTEYITTDLIVSADYGMDLSSPETGNIQSISLAKEAIAKSHADIIFWMHYKGDSNCPSVLFDIILPHVEDPEIADVIRNQAKQFALQPMDDILNRPGLDFLSSVDTETRTKIDGGDPSPYYSGMRASAKEEGKEMNAFLNLELTTFLLVTILEGEIPKEVWAPDSVLYNEGLVPSPFDYPGLVVGAINPLIGTVFSLVDLGRFGGLMMNKVAISGDITGEFFNMLVIAKSTLYEHMNDLIHGPPEVQHYAAMETFVSVAETVFVFGNLSRLSKLASFGGKVEFEVHNFGDGVAKVSADTDEEMIEYIFNNMIGIQAFPDKVGDPFYTKLKTVITDVDQQNKLFELLGELDKESSVLADSNAYLKSIVENPDYIDALKIIADAGVDNDLISWNEVNLVLDRIDEINAFDGGYNAWRRTTILFNNITDAVSAHVDDITTKLYRGDSRSPDVIFDEGFSATGTSTSVFEHITGNNRTIYISTSKKPSVASNFGNHSGGHVYIVKKEGFMIDVNMDYFSIVPNHDLVEVLFRRIIPSKNIVGAFEVGITGHIIGDLIENPNYIP